jgi:hypothetical protein
MKTSTLLALGAALALAACGKSEPPAANVANELSADQANAASEPFGATGAPGADLTDNGTTDGSNGFMANQTGNSSE